MPLSGVDVLYVSTHAIHASVMEGWALGCGHPVGAHGVVAHHHVVGVAWDEHRLRMHRGRELRHLRVGAGRGAVHVGRPVHVRVALGAVQVRVARLHWVVHIVHAL